MDEKNKELANFVLFLVVGVVLAFGIITGYDKYSYNQGFHDGLSAMCDYDVVLDKSSGEFGCVDLDAFSSVNSEGDGFVFPVVEVGE